MNNYVDKIQKFEESTKDMPTRKIVKIMKDAKRRIQKGQQMTDLQMFLLMKQREMQMKMGNNNDERSTGEESEGTGGDDRTTTPEVDGCTGGSSEDCQETIHGGDSEHLESSQGSGGEVVTEVNAMLMAKQVGADIYIRLKESKLKDFLPEEGLQLVAAITTEVLVDMAKEEQ